ncbi:MAG: hypothetical protein IT306_27660 [Chloroflexi bacterium]|nr:hypothetical protein [Chloroflexota bacterium]
MTTTAPPRLFVPAPPFPPAYGRAASIALGLGLFGGFLTGLYALGAPAFGWPGQAYAPLVQAHGQIQTLGFAGLLIVGVGGLILPGFWRAKLAHPEALSVAGWLVGIGLLAQLVGQPLPSSIVRSGLLIVAALLPPLGFAWAGRQLVAARPASAGRPAPWECLLLVGAFSLVGALLVRAISLIGLAQTGMPADYGLPHQLLVLLEVDGFLLAATSAVQLRLLPPLARVRPVSQALPWLGIGGLALALLARVAGLVLDAPLLAVLGIWLSALAVLALFIALGLWRPGVPPTVEAPATLLPGRTRVVLRVCWAGLLISQWGRALGVLPSDAITHAFTAVYLVPLIVAIGIRMLPRVSAYPIRFPGLSGALVWAAVAGGLLRAFGLVIGGLLADGSAGVALGAQLGWLGGGLLTTVMVVFVVLAWSPWGVPTGPQRSEIMQIEVPGKAPRRAC